LRALCPAHLTLPLYLATLMVSGEEYNSSFRFVYLVPPGIIFSLIKTNTEVEPLVGCAQLFNRHTPTHLLYPKPVSLRNPKTCNAVVPRGSTEHGMA